MKRIITVTFLAFICTFSSVGQIKKNQFLVHQHISWAYFHAPLRMTFPTDGYVIQKTSLFGVEKNQKPELGDNYLGIKILLIRPLSNIGGFIYLDYKTKGISLLKPTTDKYINIRSQIFAPAVGLRFVTGDFTKPKKLVLQIGAAYNYTIKHKGEYNDVKAVNNGLTGIFGFGFDFIPGRRESTTEWMPKNGFISVILQYHKDFYNYFNNNYSDGSGNYPYTDFKTNFGYIVLTTTIRGSSFFYHDKY